MNEIKHIAIKNLSAAPDNPFKVQMDAEMEQLIESIAENGVITPIIARETENGKYEIISGHRRKFASSERGLKKLPSAVRSRNSLWSFYTHRLSVSRAFFVALIASYGKGPFPDLFGKRPFFILRKAELRL